MPGGSRHGKRTLKHTRLSVSFNVFPEMELNWFNDIKVFFSQNNPMLLHEINYYGSEWLIKNLCTLYSIITIYNRSR